MINAIRLDAKNPRYYGHAADIDVKLHEYQLAEVEYRHAVQLNGKAARYHASLAGVLRLRGKTKEADQEDARAKALRPRPKPGRDAAIDKEP